MTISLGVISDNNFFETKQEKSCEVIQQTLFLNLVTLQVLAIDLVVTITTLHIITFVMKWSKRQTSISGNPEQLLHYLYNL